MCRALDICVNQTNEGDTSPLHSPWFQSHKRLLGHCHPSSVCFHLCGLDPPRSEIKIECNLHITNMPSAHKL